MHKPIFCDSGQRRYHVGSPIFGLWLHVLMLLIPTSMDLVDLVVGFVRPNSVGSLYDEISSSLPCDGMCCLGLSDIHTHRRFKQTRWTASLRPQDSWYVIWKLYGRLCNRHKTWGMTIWASSYPLLPQHQWKILGIRQSLDRLIQRCHKTPSPTLRVCFNTF